jgi:hypothetical protein
MCYQLTGIYTDADTPLKMVSTGKLRPGRSKTMKVSYNGQSATGRYISAVIDKNNFVNEINEGNNICVSGRIP